MHALEEGKNIKYLLVEKGSFWWRYESRTAVALAKVNEV